MGNTILLADKSITIQKIVELTFSDDQYEIKCVNDGQAALEAIPQVRPSIILADISLPVTSGYELCEKIRKDPSFAEFSRTPVILLAGIYETMDEERSRAVEERVREVGANDLLSKPFDPQLLTTKVKELMANAAPAFVDDSLSRTQNFDMGSDITQTGLLDQQVESDVEKTMMLPGFSANVFAEAPGFEGVDVDPHQATVKINSASSPVSEPIFEEAQLQSEPEVAEPVAEQRPTFDFNDGSFIPQQEPEFSFEGSEETVISREALYASKPKESVFEPALFEPPQEDQTTVPRPAAIIPDADEPFGDVFETSESAASWNTESSEEDSPFGLPEVPAPPPPVVEEPVEVMSEAKDAETTGPLRVPAEVTWSEPAAASDIEEVTEDAEEPAQQSEMTPVFGEDIWSRERSLAGERTAEELFDSEPSQDTVPAVEEAVELQPDLSETESVQDESNITAKQPALTAPAVAAPPEITEELINKIADRVVGKLSEKVISDIVWQVVPDLAEKMIRRELEKLHAGEE
jgi:CheY-like chemotaxis protein